MQTLPISEGLPPQNKANLAEILAQFSADDDDMNKYFIEEAFATSELLLQQKLCEIYNLSSPDMTRLIDLESKKKAIQKTHILLLERELDLFKAKVENKKGLF